MWLISWEILLKLNQSSNRIFLVKANISTWNNGHLEWDMKLFLISKMDILKKLNDLQGLPQIL